MNNITTNKIKSLNSLEVAEMVEKDHSKLLRDIRQYCEYLAEANIGLGEFFIESTYIDGNNQTRPCYNITKKGCDMVANKLTGKKGTLFTAKYVTRFEEMEQATIKLKPMQLLELQYEAMKDIDNKVDIVSNDLQKFKQELPLLAIDCDELQKKVRQTAIKTLGGYKSNAYEDVSLRSKVYKDIQHEIKREFDVSSYKAIHRNQLGTAINILSKYEAPLVLKNLIYQENYG